jgi:hypothetical protein
MIARQATFQAFEIRRKEQFTVRCGSTGTCSGCKNHASGNISIWDMGDFRDEERPQPSTCHNYKERAMDEAQDEVN